MHNEFDSLVWSWMSHKDGVMMSVDDLLVECLIFRDIDQVLIKDEPVLFFIMWVFLCKGLSYSFINFLAFLVDVFYNGIVILHYEGPEKGGRENGDVLIVCYPLFKTSL